MKKILKGLITLILSLVMVLGFIPNYISEVNASDEYGLYIQCRYSNVCTYTVPEKYTKGDWGRIIVSSGQEVDLKEFNFQYVDGYEFDHWLVKEYLVEDTVDLDITDGVFTMPNKEITIYPVFKQHYLKFSNRLYDAASYTLPSGYDEFDTALVCEGDVIDLSEFNLTCNDGYAFDGWAFEEYFTSKSENIEVVDNKFTMPDYDVMIVPKYSLGDIRFNTTHNSESCDVISTDVNMRDLTFNNDKNYSPVSNGINYYSNDIRWGWTEEMGYMTAMYGENYMSGKDYFTEYKMAYKYITFDDVYLNGEKLDDIGKDPLEDYVTGYYNDGETLYIGYRKDTGKFTVSFDANGGTGSMDDIKVYRSFKLPEKCTGLIAPAGKKFIGWCQDTSGSYLLTGDDLYQYIYNDDDDYTYYAIWGDAVTVEYTFETTEEEKRINEDTAIDSFVISGSSTGLTGIPTLDSNIYSFNGVLYKKYNDPKLVAGRYKKEIQIPLADKTQVNKIIVKINGEIIDEDYFNFASLEDDILVVNYLFDVAPKYSVTFDYNDARETKTITQKSLEREFDLLEINDGMYIDTETIDNNKVFVGWTTVKDDISSIVSGTKYSFALDDISKIKTLYAYWDDLKLTDKNLIENEILAPRTNMSDLFKPTNDVNKAKYVWQKETDMNNPSLLDSPTPDELPKYYFEKSNVDNYLQQPFGKPYSSYFAGNVESEYYEDEDMQYINLNIKSSDGTFKKGTTIKVFVYEEDKSETVKGTYNNVLVKIGQKASHYSIYNREELYYILEEDYSNPIIIELNRDGSQHPFNIYVTIQDFEDVVGANESTFKPTASGEYRACIIKGDTKVYTEISSPIIVPTSGSGGSKKYKAIDTKDTTEKITGTGKKGSKRTIVPEEGRKVANVVVTDKEGNEIEVTMNEDGTYSFVQPASNVNVEVTYKNREITLNIGSTLASVDGEKSNLDVCPVIRNDRTMLPIRFVAENLGAKVEWDEKKPNYVVITRGDTKIEITLGSDIMKVNGSNIVLDSVAFAENDRTYLPVRAVSEALNAYVEWHENEPSVVKIFER